MKLVSAILKPFKSHAARSAFVPTRPDHGARDARTSVDTVDAVTALRDSDDAPSSHACAVSRWLFPQVVLLDCDVRDKREVLDLAAATLERFHGVPAAPVARALWRREGAISTALGEGVAVPHARIDGIAEPVTLLIRTLHPIAYEAPDRKPVSQLFVIVVPADGDPDDHLQLLANVAQLFSQPAFRERVAAAADMRAARRAFEEYADAIVGDASAAPPSAPAHLSGESPASARRSRSRRE